MNANMLIIHIYVAAPLMFLFIVPTDYYILEEEITIYASAWIQKCHAQVLRISPHQSTSSIDSLELNYPLFVAPMLVFSIEGLPMKGCGALCIKEYF